MENKIRTAIEKVAKEKKISLNFNKQDTSLKDLGIDSLIAIDLIIKIEEELGVTLDDDVLMKIKTLSDLIEAFKNKLR
ncbi:acyl carrier protein [Ureaplasma canigenitalium]|uniref:acyl carrier protein n=1 Tax=Ureaplasma canigenitalium TaxID=42092 RepID=UPI0004E185E0|nr:acyl carrier protein [Ureaplasma canigenitalium]